MENNIREKIFSRICDYQKIRELSIDTSKISNLAHDEMVISFLELLYKFDGIEFLKTKVEFVEIDDRVKVFIASLMLPIDETYAIALFEKLTFSSVESVALSCRNVINEKYGSKGDLKLGYRKIIVDMAKRKRIQLPENIYHD